jgi:hypothetical protein
MRFAIAAPIPDKPPVTTAIFPSSRMLISGLFPVRLETMVVRAGLGSSKCTTAVHESSLQQPRHQSDRRRARPYRWLESDTCSLRPTPPVLAG